MRFVVSACLLGCNCKYSGGNNLNPRVQEFLRDKEYIPICPEVDGGLPTPRAASEIAGGDGLAVLEGKAKVLTETGMDVTRHFLRGARIAVQAARDFGAGAALLKERSPSCGAAQYTAELFRHCPGWLWRDRRCPGPGGFALV